MPELCSQGSNLAIAHDYLIQMGGAERVVASMARHFPEAAIYTSYTVKDGLLPEFEGREIRNSWLRLLPINQQNFKKFFPLYPVAFHTFRPPEREIVWMSCSTFAKCLPKPKNGVSFCYCHSPTRFIWEARDYLHKEISSPVVTRSVKSTLPIMRRLDRWAAQRPDHLIANSRFVQHRIRAAYRRSSEIIYPPVNIDRFSPSTTNDGYYLIVSRLIGYKRVDLAIEAFRGLDRELHIVGDGTDRKRLEGIATDNVKFLGRISDEEVLHQFTHCQALLFPGCEDFGITPVEAMACGKPVIAFGAGGSLETVVPEQTGIHFREQTPESLRAAILACERETWNVPTIRAHAETFSEERFLTEMTNFMKERLDPVRIQQANPLNHSAKAAGLWNPAGRGHSPALQPVSVGRKREIHSIHNPRLVTKFVRRELQTISESEKRKVAAFLTRLRRERDPDFFATMAFRSARHDPSDWQPIDTLIKPLR